MAASSTSLLFSQGWTATAGKRSTPHGLVFRGLASACCARASSEAPLLPVGTPVAMHAAHAQPRPDISRTTTRTIPLWLSFVAVCCRSSFLFPLACFMYASLMCMLLGCVFTASTRAAWPRLFEGMRQRIHTMRVASRRRSLMSFLCAS